MDTVYIRGVTSDTTDYVVYCKVNDIWMASLGGLTYDEAKEEKIRLEKIRGEGNVVIAERQQKITALKG